MYVVGSTSSSRLYFARTEDDAKRVAEAFVISLQMASFAKNPYQRAKDISENTRSFIDKLRYGIVEEDFPSPLYHINPQRSLTDLVDLSYLENFIMDTGVADDPPEAA
jgi:hypothetical protein